MKLALLIIPILILCTKLLNAQKHKKQNEDFMQEACSYEKRVIHRDTLNVFCDSIFPDANPYVLINHDCFYYYTIPDGKWAAVYTDGKPAVMLTIKHGKKEGIARSWYPNGRPCQEIEFRSGERTRYYRSWTKDGLLHEEHLPDSTANTTHYRVMKNNKLMKEGYYLYRTFDRISRDHLIDSLITLIDDDGTPLITNGNGVISKYHKSGNRSYEASYVNGKLEGAVCSWDENGVKTGQTTYLEGRKYGYWFDSYVSGIKREEGYYKWDQKDSVWTSYYLDGRPMRMETYLFGRKQGLSAAWYESGMLEEEKYYWNDRFILGDYCKWYEDGTLKSYSNYRLGDLRHEIYFDSKGRKWIEKYRDKNTKWEKYYWKGIRIRKKRS